MRNNLAPPLVLLLVANTFLLNVVAFLHLPTLDVRRHRNSVTHSSLFSSRTENSSTISPRPSEIHPPLLPSRRTLFVEYMRCLGGVSTATAIGNMAWTPVAYAADAQLDVNNMLGREYMAFPGLYPTIANKIMSGGRPYKTKQEVYDSLGGNEAMIDRLKTYEKVIVVKPFDGSARSPPNRI
mmetsp:Transcript_44280/g.86903  ORF Transcript_44280/g.86903 Transcript_44280/m.86903 type:complete len:182 (+) Transcript_44280:92-637(+)